MSPGPPRPPIECSANQRPASRELSRRLMTRGSSSTCASQALRESPASMGTQIAYTGVSAFVRRTGQPRWLPCCSLMRRALANVEERAARVHAGCGRRHVVVRLVPLRRCDPLEDPGWRSRAVTTNGKNPAGPIRERNLENGCAVRPSPPADVVDEAHIGLVVGAHPGDKRGDLIGAASGGRAPCASPFAAPDPPPLAGATK